MTKTPLKPSQTSTAPTQFVESKLEKYGYRRFRKGAGLPLLCLQHFTGTLDNWDPAVCEPRGCQTHLRVEDPQNSRDRRK